MIMHHQLFSEGPDMSRQATTNVRRRRAVARERGPRLFELLRNVMLRTVPDGSFVAINCVNGSFTHGPTRIAAIDAFRMKFGGTIGWIRKFRA